MIGGVVHGCPELSETDVLVPRTTPWCWCCVTAMACPLDLLARWRVMAVISPNDQHDVTMCVPCAPSMDWTRYRRHQDPRRWSFLVAPLASATRLANMARIDSSDVTCPSGRTWDRVGWTWSPSRDHAGYVWKETRSRPLSARQPIVPASQNPGFRKTILEWLGRPSYLLSISSNLALRV